VSWKPAWATKIKKEGLVGEFAALQEAGCVYLLYHPQPSVPGNFSFLIFFFKGETEIPACVQTPQFKNFLLIRCLKYKRQSMKN
jgi:hypothetical protein